MVTEFNGDGGGGQCSVRMVREYGCGGAVGIGRRGGYGVEGRGRGRE